MKNLLLSVLLAVAAIWANPSAKWSAFNFEEGFFGVDTSKYCLIDTTYINCMDGIGLAYYSTLDTNFAVFFYAKSKILVKGTQDAVSFTYQHSAIQVFRYEFMKWQEWGVLDISKDSAQFLIDTFVPDSANAEGTYWIRHECLSDMSLCGVQVEWGGSSANLSRDEAELLPQQKKQDDVDLIDTGSQDSSADTLEVPLLFQDAFSNGVAKGALRGCGYRIFDMNGVLLGRGVWNGSIRHLNGHVILKFDNGFTSILR